MVDTAEIAMAYVRAQSKTCLECHSIDVRALAAPATIAMAYGIAYHVANCVGTERVLVLRTWR